jgi:hypothetical protein
MIVTAPEVPNINNTVKFRVFLAGTIDNGASVDWQDKAGTELSDGIIALGFTEDEFIIVNPRRKDWNKDATEIDIVAQIVWEQNFLEKSDFILFNILKDSLSPVTLLELGLCLWSNKYPIVVCEPGFWRETNVNVTCIRNGVTPLPTLEVGIKETLALIDTVVTK